MEWRGFEGQLVEGLNNEPLRSGSGGRDMSMLRPPWESRTPLCC